MFSQSPALNANSFLDFDPVRHRIRLLSRIDHWRSSRSADRRMAVRGQISLCTFCIGRDSFASNVFFAFIALLNFGFEGFDKSLRFAASWPLLRVSHFEAARSRRRGALSSGAQAGAKSILAQAGTAVSAWCLASLRNPPVTFVGRPYTVYLPYTRVPHTRDAIQREKAFRPA